MLRACVLRSERSWVPWAWLGLAWLVAKRTNVSNQAAEAKAPDGDRLFTDGIDDIAMGWLDSAGWPELSSFAARHVDIP